MNFLSFLQQVFANLGSISWLALGLWLLPFGLILLDFVTGTLSAIKRGVWQGLRFSDYLNGDGQKYAVALILVFGVYLATGSVAAQMLASAFSLGPLAISVLTSIGSNLKELLPAQAAPFIDRAESAAQQELAALTTRTPFAIPATGQPSTQNVPAVPQMVSTFEQDLFAGGTFQQFAVSPVQNSGTASTPQTTGQPFTAN